MYCPPNQSSSSAVTATCTREQLNIPPIGMMREHPVEEVTSSLLSLDNQGSDADGCYELIEDVPLSTTVLQTTTSDAQSRAVFATTEPVTTASSLFDLQAGVEKLPENISGTSSQRGRKPTRKPRSNISGTARPIKSANPNTSNPSTQTGQGGLDKKTRNKLAQRKCRSEKEATIKGLEAEVRRLTQVVESHGTDADYKAELEHSNTENQRLMTENDAYKTQITRLEEELEYVKHLLRAGEEGAASIARDTPSDVTSNHGEPDNRGDVLGSTPDAGRSYISTPAAASRILRTNVGGNRGEDEEEGDPEIFSEFYGISPEEVERKYTRYY